MPATYKIPQNVDLEDKILGPLTLKQFLYTLGAGMITFVSFSTFYTLVPALFYVITFLTWTITAAIVFVRPNDQPFLKFVFAFLWFSLKPNRRVWKRIPTLSNVPDTEPVKVAPPPPAPSSTEVRSRLQRLAHVVDTRGWSTLEAGSEMGDRVVSAPSAAPVINIHQSSEPEDVLAAEDEARGSDRATAELDRVLRRGVTKPDITPPPAPAPAPAPPEPAATEIPAAGAAYQPVDLSNRQVTTVS